MKAADVLPLITPPFVIGLSIILLFGVSGTVTQFLEWAFDVQPTRYIYGLPGIWLAQTLAFTPIAFLVLIGLAGLAVGGVGVSAAVHAYLERNDNG